MRRATATSLSLHNSFVTCFIAPLPSREINWSSSFAITCYLHKLVQSRLEIKAEDYAEDKEKGYIKARFRQGTSFLNLQVWRLSFGYFYYFPPSFIQTSIMIFRSSVIDILVGNFKIRRGMVIRVFFVVCKYQIPLHPKKADHYQYNEEMFTM